MDEIKISDHRVSGDALIKTATELGVSFETLTDKIRRQVGLPPSKETDKASIELIEFKRQLSSVADQLRRSDGTIDVEQIFDLPRRIDDLAKRLDHVESYKPKEFAENDVFEVNKRIERLEAKVALINSILVNNPAVQFCLRFWGR